MKLRHSVILLVTNTLKCVVWCCLLGWLSVLALYWFTCPAHSVIDQCTVATRVAAGAVVGYAACRAAVEVVASVGKLVDHFTGSET